MFKIIKILLILSIVFIFSVDSLATDTFKSFDMRSAMINYEIKGEGNLTENSYLLVNGKSALVFEEWGARILYKEKYLESTTGGMKSTKTIRALYLEDHGIVYRADFEKHIIETSEDPILKAAITTGEDLYQKAIEQMKENGKNIGSSEVLGYPCDEWVYKGKIRCYYKGIPLKEVSTVSGIAVTKIAISAQFDLNISQDIFTLPDFERDEQKGFLMTDSKEELAKQSSKKEVIIEDNVSVVKEFAPIEKTEQDIKSEEATVDKTALIEKSEVEKTVQVEELVIEVASDLTKNIFQEQKAWLPKLLAEMQEARVCLENSFKASDANECLFKLVEIEEQMSGEQSEERIVTRWTDLTGIKIMDDLEEGILDLKRRMPCIRRSQNFDDLAECMRSDEVEK